MIQKSVFLLMCYIVAVMFSIALFGCKSVPVDNIAKPTPGRYVAFWSNSFAVGQVLKDRGVPVSPDGPNPSPVPRPVVSSKDCTICKGRGYTMSGDGIQKIDCECDYDGDGDPYDPIFWQESKEVSLKDIKIELPAKIKADELSYWLGDPIAAKSQASLKNKKILTYLGFSEPELDKETIDKLRNKYILFFEDITELDIANAWAQQTPNHELVEKDGNNYRFVEPVFCILNSDGTFSGPPYQSYKELNTLISEK